MAQGLSFGKGLIFTYGPYVAIHTKAYHPSTDFMMVSGSLYLALSYWTYLFLLMKDAQWRLLISLCAILAGLMNSWDDFFLSMFVRDALLLSVPLLVGLVSFKLQSMENGWQVNNKRAPFYLALLFLPLGLLPLIKGSLMILCGAVAVLCSALFIANRQFFLASVCLLSPMVAMLFFWMASGQSMADLPGYFIGMAPIVSGYTEAMAIESNIHEVVAYLMASAFLLLALSLQTQTTGAAKIFLLCIYFVYLFISFKAGFVRHDVHALICGFSILIAALLLPLTIKGGLVFPATFVSLMVWGYIDSYRVNTSTTSIINNAKATYSSMWYGINNRLKNKNWPRLEFDAAINALKAKAAFPILQGTTDIYSYNQAYLIASGNTWSPRPIFQSYSVYTPELAEINRKHILGPKAPDNIIFRVEPIDDRIPSLEDGASWPILMLNYRPTQMVNDFLFLKKNGHIGDIGYSPLASETHTFWETVKLPESDQPVFAQIEIKPTILGRITGILFKPSPLKITIELKNGIKKQFGIITTMAKSGLMLSPLIENTTEFGMLYGKAELLDGKWVKSMMIAPSDGKTLLWNDEYTVSFSQIKTPPPQDSLAKKLSPTNTDSVAEK